MSRFFMNVELNEIIDRLSGISLDVFMTAQEGPDLSAINLGIIIAHLDLF